MNNITVSYLAKEYAQLVSPAWPDSLSRQQMIDQEYDRGCTAYNFVVTAFNVASAVLITSVALSVIGLLSASTGLFLGALSFLSRDIILESFREGLQRDLFRERPAIFDHFNAVTHVAFRHPIWLRYLPSREEQNTAVPVTE